MKKIAICVAMLMWLALSTKGQEKTNIRFLITDAASGDLITGDDVSLKILSDHYGIGDEHPFVGGICTIKYPVDRQLKYTIISPKYFLQGELIKEYNVIPGNSNTVTISLMPMNERDLVIKGRIRDKAHNDLFGCKVEIDMTSSFGNKKAITDSSGFFQMIFENGKTLIGTNFKVSVRNPSYEPFDSVGTVENKTINDLGDMIMRPKLKPPKIGYLNFKGPEKSVNSIVLISEDFSADELKPGFWRIVNKASDLPVAAKFRIECKDCFIDSLFIPTASIIDRTYTQDINDMVNYPAKFVRLILNGNYDMLMGKNLNQKGATAIKVGISKSFSIARKWFEIDVSATLWTTNFTEIDKYLTLPGNEGVALNNFSLTSLPQLQLRYFFKPPTAKKPTYYVGFSGTFVRQTFQNVTSDQLISEELQHLSSFAPGLNGGIRYNISQAITFCGAISVDYLKITNVNYQFNYFGRADQSKFTDNQLKLNLNVSMLYNL